MGIMVSWLSNVLWQGIEHSNSFSGARDYARSANASWTALSKLHIFCVNKLIQITCLFCTINHIQYITGVRTCNPQMRVQALRPLSQFELLSMVLAR